MNISLLNIVVKIQKTTIAKDSIGNHKNVWSDYYTCHATVSGENGKEISSSGIVTDNSDLTLSIRWCERVSKINSTEYRIVFNKELYNISSVDHMNYKRKSIKLKCSKVRI